LIGERDHTASASVHASCAIYAPTGTEVGNREFLMKKTYLAAVILLAGSMAGSLTAEAQRQPTVDANGNPVVRSGNRPTTGTTNTTRTLTPASRPTPPPAPVVVVQKPVQKVFVPVRVPTIPAWNTGSHSYPKNRHRECQQKSHNLHSFERHAADDGYLSPRERSTISALKRDLDRTCGGHRWR
jgi:hypothetical protein